MAISSALVVSGKDAPGDPNYFHRATFTVGGDSYATGGLAWDPIADITDTPLRGKTVVAVVPLGGAGYVAEYDHTNKKVKVFYADYDAVADGALIEHPASALTAVFEFLIVAK